MKKCDFCVKSNPDGTCYYDSCAVLPRVASRYDCEEAIKMMTKALKNGDNVVYDKKKNWW